MRGEKGMHGVYFWLFRMPNDGHEGSFKGETLFQFTVYYFILNNISCIIYH